jgi:hypothetical protein
MVMTTEKDQVVMDRLDVLKDALALIVELWPKPGYASVTLETHQWVRLRRVLLAIPDLVADERPEHVCERCVHG